MKISEEVVFQEEAFDVLNERYFESALSRPAITIQSTPRAHGHFTPYDAWDNRHGLKLKEINLGAESLRRPVSEVIATLMHEMVHYYCHVQGIKDVSRGNTYHNKRFKEEAEKRGLIIGYSAGVGYSLTRPSQSMADLVRDLGWLDKLQLYRNPEYKTSADGSKKGNGEKEGPESKKKSSTRKYVCPKCGLSIRATKEVHIACIDCRNIPMEPVLENTKSTQIAKMSTVG